MLKQKNSYFIDQLMVTIYDAHYSANDGVMVAKQFMRTDRWRCGSYMHFTNMISKPC